MLNKRSVNGKSITGSPSSTTSAASQSANEENPTNDGRLSRNSSDDSDNIGNDKIKQSIQMRKTRRRTSSMKQNNSAGESSCCSSHELSPDEQQSTLKSTHSNYLVASSTCSQETYCSELEFSVNANNKNTNFNLFDNNYPNSQESISYNVSEFSQTSSSQGNVYENSRPLVKFDSQTSTISDFSLDIASTQSNASDANCGNGSLNQMSFDKPSDSSSGIDSMMTAGTTTTNASESLKKKAKKRKINFGDEVSGSDVDDDVLMSKKFKAMEAEDPSNGMCMICLSEPKNGAFVHNRFLHVCCCYRCTVKVWNKRKRCPICNSQVKTVLKMFVH